MKKPVFTPRPDTDETPLPRDPRMGAPREENFPSTIIISVVDYEGKARARAQGYSFLKVENDSFETWVRGAPAS